MITHLLSSSMAVAHHRTFLRSVEDDEASPPLLLPLPPLPPSPDVEATTCASVLMQTIRDCVLGERRPLCTPFGRRALFYADYTASGRALSFLEEYIRDEVLPYYGNTHTSTSSTGQQTHWFREESRQMIARCVGADERDVVLFTGTGATGALVTLAHVLDLCGVIRRSTWEERPVVFLGPMEHHSNLLVWRESGAIVVPIEEAEGGGIDLCMLQTKLIEYRHVALKIGSFCAASNVTGILVDTDTVTALLHRHGALAVWDFATAAPHVAVQMNPSVLGPDRHLVYKDAVVLSPHKFVGGPQTPGVLIVKRSIIQNTVPSVPGGGTVFFVTEKDHRYLENQEEREEGGTPDIVGAIRTGLVLQLHRAVGDAAIQAREQLLCQRALDVLRPCPNLVLLGPSTTRRLPIFSFLVRHGKRFLHPNYVSALLNDLFGIQTRSGCACAGPYAQRLLGIDVALAKRYEEELLKDNELLRPGFTRFSLCYFFHDEDVSFLLRAISWVAAHGYALLPLYVFFSESGEWRHKSCATRSLDRVWLGAISYREGCMAYPSHHPREMTCKEPRETLFEIADTLATRTLEECNGLAVDQSMMMEESSRALSWIVLPSDIIMEAKGRPMEASSGPFSPPKPCENRSCALPTLPDKDCATEEAAAGSSRSSAPLPLPRHKGTMGFVRPPRSLMRPLGRAITEHEMIHEGDRLLLGLSGGKDSLTLLHLLHELQQRAPVHFELGACTVDPQVAEFDPSPLRAYMASLGVPYYYESQAILERATGRLSTRNASICSWCSRMRRGVLYACARREGYNVLVLAQHLDDLAESFLMSCFHNGQMNTMKANYVIGMGDLRVVRPLVYVRERQTRQFAEDNNLPVIWENCPACFEAPKERYRMKQLLAAQEHLFPKIFQNLSHAMQELLSIRGTDTPES